ncbi:aminoacyl-histidine dipeptidase [bacterium]|nr:aminoacyl-histidine dipeptidase [bacterium]
MKYSEDAITQGVLEIFEAINMIPRKSKNEEKISQWLLDWGLQHGFQAEMDQVRNVLIRVPATSGYEDKPVVTLQGHMDMVCVKDLEIEHDFFKDPITMRVEDGWLKANGTTLGADNGIALAIAMYLATDKEAQHGPLELLFTVDEETGLTGAAALKENWLKGKYLLNIDSEDEGVFTIGCAGGEETRLYYPLELTDPTEGFKAMQVKVSNLMGGHSGVMINEQQANAIQIANRVMIELDSACDLEISNYHGGIAHNAVPHNAEIDIYIDPADIEDAQEIIAECQETMRKEFITSDPKMKIELIEVAGKDQVFTREFATKITQVLAVYPHGIFRMSKQIKDLVETSNNLALINTADNQIVITSSQRSSVMSMLQVLTDKIHFLGFLTGAKVENRDPYNAWEPIWDSNLLDKTKATYKKITGNEPKIEVIHAGLECGLIGSKYPEMEMISMGPTIKNVHTPREELLIEDIARIYTFIKELLLVV